MNERALALSEQNKKANLSQDAHNMYLTKLPIKYFQMNIGTKT